MADVGTVSMPVKPDMKKFGKGIKGWFGGLGSKLLIGAGIALGAKFAIGFGKSLADAAEETASAVAAVTQAIANQGAETSLSAQGVFDLTKEMQNYSGIQDEVINQSAAMLATFHNVRNEVGEGNDVFDRGTKVALDMSVAYGTDMKAATIQVGKALQDPIKGMTALNRVGVTFTDQQKEQVKALVESGDSMGAQKLILEELEAQVGGQAEAQADASAKMSASWMDVKSALGEFLLPVMEKVAGWMQKTLVPFVEGTLVPAIRDKLIPAFINIGKFILSKVVPPIKNYLIPAFKAVVDFITTKVVPFVKDELIPAFEKFVGFLNEKVIPVVREKVLGAFEKLNTFVSQNLVPFIRDTLVPIFRDQVVPALQRVAEFIGKNTDLIGPFVAVIVGAVVVFKTVVAVTKAWAIAQGILNVIMTANPIGLIVVAIAAFVAAIIIAYKRVDWFRDFIDGVFNWIRDFWAEWGDEIMAFFRTVFKVVWTVIKFYVTTYWNIIKTIFNAIKAFWDKWGDEITAAIKVIFNIVKTIIGTAINVVKTVITTVLNALSSAWDRWGDDVMRVLGAVKRFIESTISTIRGILEGIISFVQNVFKGNWSDAWSDIQGIFDDILAAIIRVMQSFGGLMLDAFKEAWRITWDFLKSLPGKAANVGRDLVQGIVNGIKSAAGRIASAIRTSITNKLPGWIKGPLGIGSPSKVTMLIGQQIGEGLAIGITNTAKDVEAATQRLAALASPSVGGGLELDAFGELDQGIAGLRVTNVFNGPVGGSMEDFARQISREAAVEARFTVIG